MLELLFLKVVLIICLKFPISRFLRPSSPQVCDVYRGHRGADWVAAVAGGREARDDAYAAAVPCRPSPCRLTVPRLAQPELLGE